MRNLIGVSSLAVLVAVTAPAAPGLSQQNACSNTTKAALSACLYDALDTFWIDVGKCRNESESSDQTACRAEASATLADSQQACRAERDARDDLCAELGEAPYDPRFEPADFVDPTRIGNGVAPNPWFPLIGGRTMVYRSKDETVTVTVTDDVRVIDNVPCVVVRDVVKSNGELLEDTIDWFAQDVYGNVWYCGEATAEYEDGFPVNVDGSFQADVNGARPGIIMKAAPAVGNVYRQEFDLANAEDAARVVDLHGSARTPAASCARTCLVTEEFTPLHPGASENKYYKPGVGFILQVDRETGARSELVKIVDE